MPYPRAHHYVLGVIAVILLGFWPSYFGAWSSAPWQFHAHGTGASLWVLMVAAQSWTAHNRQLTLHRAVGKSSLLLFPFLIGGLAAIVDLTAKGYVAGEGVSRTMFGASFLIGVLVAIAAYVAVFYRALKFRRKVWLHSGYMLTTPLILFESPFGRILNGFMPGLQIRGAEDLHLIMPAILVSMALELAFIAILWARYRAKATPFLVAGGFIVVQMLTMGLMGESALLKSALTILGGLPSASVVLAGFALGAATSWAGWKAGERPGALPAQATQPA